MKIDEKEIKDALDKAYEKAGHNAYFDNGFKLGIEFVLDYIKTNEIRYLPSDTEEFGRKCFYGGREVEKYNEHGIPIFFFPTYNGYLRHLEGGQK